MKKSFFKILRGNDTGATGSHQAGVAIPKSNRELLDFFPFLNPKEDNPDAWITCIDPNQEKWEMRYIYYNGKLTGKSTRDEYRLTHTTKFLSLWGAKTGDKMVFESTSQCGVYLISIQDQKETDSSEEKRGATTSRPPVIKLKGWHRAY